MLVMVRVGEREDGVRGNSEVKAFDKAKIDHASGNGYGLVGTYCDFGD